MKLNSYTITQGRDRAPARAMLKAIGFNDEDQEANYRGRQYLDRNHAVQLYIATPRASSRGSTLATEKRAEALRKPSCCLQ